MKKSSYLYIAAAAILWGTMSIFVTKLGGFGLSSMQIVFFRALVAALILIVYLLIKNPAMLKIRPKDFPIFIGTGIISFTCFSYCYFTAMHLCSISVAAVLLYTAPAFVLLMSALLFKEKLTVAKGMAVIITIAGCALVTGVFGGTASMSVPGILFGLGAGFGYVLYSIFGRYGIERYHTLTVTTYTFIFVAVASLPFVFACGAGAITFTCESVIWIISVGIFTSAMPYLLYTAGLTHIEPGRASVIATIKPVVAALIGTFLFGEPMNASKIIGIILVFCAVALINLKKE